MSKNENWRSSRGGGGGQYKKSYFNQAGQKRKYHQLKLASGMKGFIITCNKIMEKDCVRDSYNILNEFADNLFGVDGPIKPVEEVVNEDVDASLEHELAELKKETNKPTHDRRFQTIDSGSNAVVFIKTTVPDPVKLAYTIVSHVNETKVQRSRAIFRLIPVEMTCKAYVEDISNAVKTLLPKYFGEQEKTFAVIISLKNNNSLTKMDIINDIADQVCAINKENKVNLDSPELAIIVDVIRNVCCLSVVQEYYQLKKYNILELSGGATDEKQSKSEEQPVPPNEAPELDD